ncbi:hypothetical protein DQ04_04131080 [Trypanosoma grayi]|uniref:hypothetical protein n=1 Tax=Trypanosoma grayi TaxID=71804 RepID=UPI0004F3EF88|nr:hypothetical protein DQ04_04131080 [Trypanosoma grayi]KEG10140.1 hypothetical protein DQ04_04131080 [Trypanosoma grayi]
MGQASSFALRSVDRGLRRFLHQRSSEKHSPLQEGGDEESGFFTSTGPRKDTDIYFFTVNDLRALAAFLPECLSAVDLHHLPLLFVLDGDRDGLFSLNDLKQFIAWAIETLPSETSLDDVTEVLRGRTVLRCWLSCHVESQKQRGGKGVCAAREESHDSDSRESRVYFVRWALKLLESAETEDFSSSFAFTPSSLLPFPSDPSDVARDELLGASEGKPLVARIVALEFGEKPSLTGASTDKQSYRDVYEDPPPLPPEFNVHAVPLSSPRRPASARFCGQRNKRESVESSRDSPRNVFGIKALEELYQDLSVGELYGLSFWGLCQMLSPQGAEEVEKAASLQKSDATVTWMDAETAVNHHLQLACNSDTQTEPVSSFCVTTEAVEGFLMCFCKAYWNTLRRLGLRPSDGAVAER